VIGRLCSHRGSVSAGASRHPPLHCPGACIEQG
jgi:hypothetical protein